jgi:hypothetical protein
MVLIKVKNYEHYNRAMGKYIKSRKHYQEEMAKGGYIKAEKGNEIARKARKADMKDYKPSGEMKQFLNSLNPDKKGNVKLSGNQIKYMESKGVTFDRDKIEKHIKEAQNG